MRIFGLTFRVEVVVICAFVPAVTTWIIEPELIAESGRAVNPVTPPLPFIVIAIIYTIVTDSPEPIVRVTPLFIVIGPAAMAFRPSVIV